MTKRIVAISPGFVFYTRVSLLRSRTLCCCCAWALMLSARQPGPKSPLRCCSQAVAAVDSAAVAGAGDEVERERNLFLASASGQEPTQAQARSLLTLMILFKDWRQLLAPVQARPPPGRENVQG